MPDGWTAQDIPDLNGQTFVVTGANSGIGYEAARELARAGGKVVLACRSLDKAERARAQIARDASEPPVIGQLDLADLESVDRFSRWLRDETNSIQALINNAGVMALPYRQTADGFEMQLGTNHLGHFALTASVMDLLDASPQEARVVNVSSLAHRMGRIRFDDLHWEERYSKWKAYGQSKLANLLFTFELQRRASESDQDVIAVACHPGYAATELQKKGAEMVNSTVKQRFMQLGNSLFAQSATMGALPTLYAAVEPSVRGGDYIGPDGFGEMRGFPARVQPSGRARDTETARRLWDVSQQLTDATWPF